MATIEVELAAWSRTTSVVRLWSLIGRWLSALAVRARHRRSSNLPLAVLPLATLELVLVAACAAPGAELFRAHPELAPGSTAFESIEQSLGPSSDTMADYGELVRRVTTSSPRVLAAWHAWAARIEASGTAASLPLPRFKYTVPFATDGMAGPMHHLFELEQSIPSPLSLVARRDAGDALVEEARRRYEMTVLDVVTELVELLAEVRYLQQSIAATRANEQLAIQLATAAEGRLARDAGTLFDVSRARSQLAQLRLDRIRFEELLVAMTGQVCALLDLPPGLTFGPLAPWPLGRDATSLESLYRLALEREPELKALDAQVSASMARVAEARGQWWPELMVGVMWRTPGEGAVGSGTSNEVGLMVGLELPLWSRADTGSISNAEAMLAEKAFERRGRLRSVLAEIQSTWLTVRNARRLLELYDQTLLPEARRTMADASDWQTARSAGFTDFLEARGSFYSFTLNRERAYADAVKAEARLRRLTAAVPEVRP